MPRRARHRRADRGGTDLAFSLLTGSPLDLADEWAGFLFQMLIAAAPFAFLALAGIGDRLPWLVGLGLTLALWGYALFDDVSHQWHPDGSGANIGLGLVMLASPLFIAGACFGACAWQLRRGRRGADESPPPRRPPRPEDQPCPPSVQC